MAESTLREQLASIAQQAADAMDECDGSEHLANRLRLIADSPDLSKMRLHSLLRRAAEQEHDRGLADLLNKFLAQVDRLD